MTLIIDKSTISIEAEIPEALHAALTQFLETHSIWDAPRVFQTALSLFLLQQGEVERVVSRIYLDSLLVPIETPVVYGGSIEPLPPELQAILACSEDRQVESTQ